MNLVYKRCPICHKGITTTLISYECQANRCYRYSRLAHYANFFLAKDMLLQYTQFPEGPETLLLTLRKDGKFRSAFRLNFHLEANLNDLLALVKRLNNLIIFS